MTLEKAIEVLKVHQNWRLGEDTELLKESVLVEAIGVVLAELERVTTRLGESLPNGGFCVPNCKNSMKPTIKTRYGMTTYVLTYRKNWMEVAKSVFQHELVQEVQRKRSELKKDPKYRNGKFEIRTLEGFKAKNVLKESK